MQRGKRYVVPLTALALAAAAVAVVTGLDAAAAPARPHDAYASGDEAIERLGSWLPEVAAIHGLDAEELSELLLTDDTLTVDRFGALAYFDELPPDEAVDADAPGDGPSESPAVTGPEFELASLPGADLTIYLDFDGHTTTGTTWNGQYGIETIVSPPFDRDGNPDSWSAQELQIIRDSWAVVAEDYRPWQVNVTTTEPGADALRRFGQGDTRWGVRVVVTKDTWAGCGCGGHAYVGAFDDTQDEPVFVYNSTRIGISEAISHEVGHALSLAHDGTTSSSYYTGHDGTGPGWAPIMGAAYHQEVSHWSRQEYLDASNADAAANYGLGPDDVAIIANTALGNIPLRTDDHGGSDAPTPLVGSTPTVSGVIGTRDDVDAFSFTTSGGVVTLQANGVTIAPNLDIAMTLRTPAGTLVAASDPVDGLDASISATVPGGSYVVTIDGAGVGNPLASPPSGYSDYGSLGQYTLTAAFEIGEPPDTTAPAAPTGLLAAESSGDVVLDWSANTEPDLDGYVVQRDSGGGFLDVATVTASSHVDPAPPTGEHAYRVLALDASGNRSTPSTVVEVAIADGGTEDPPTHAIAETAVAGSVVGTLDATRAAGGSSQVITEVASSVKPTSRHDLLEHRWELPATTGGHALTIRASVDDGGDADDGVRFEVSDDGTSWSTVTRVAAGDSIAAVFDIGQRSGTVHVRVVDTDRSVGQYGPDRVSVDHLALVGDGVVVSRPDPTAVTATLVTSRTGAANGEQHGAATVTVTDDQGSPVSGAEVRIRFGGAFDDVMTGATGFEGTVSFSTATTARKPSFTACVVSITASLDYVPGAESC